MELKFSGTREASQYQLDPIASFVAFKNYFD